MPNRIIKESICSSENIDQLTEFQEVFFYRLMVNCDDFGRFDARLKLLSSRLFPLRDVSTETIKEALDALQKADLIMVYEVDGHPYLQMKTWEKHQQRRSDKSKYPSPDDINCNQMISDDINGYHTESDDSKCPRIRNRNRIRNTINDNRNRDAHAREDDAAHEIQDDHNRILNAAEDAGFTKSNMVRAKLIDLYAVYGLEKVLAGIESCVRHGAVNLAYLEACMTDRPREKPEKQPEKLQTERDNTGAASEALERMRRMILEEDISNTG